VSSELRRGRGGIGAAVLGGYVLVSFLYFGLRVLSHPGRTLVGLGTDPQIFVWSVAWWPHAVGDGVNPLVTHAIWAPDGFNLAWATTMPALSLVLTPLTVLAGPVVAYNVAAVLMPALAAWTAYLLCRHVTGTFWPSLAGGYVFGFSGYMLGEELGHLHMTAVFLVPLTALFVLRFVEGGLGARGLAWRLGLVLGAQLLLSTELFFTLSLALAVALALAYAVVGDLRPRLRAALTPLAGAYAIGAVLAAPLLAYAVSGFESVSVNRPRDFDTDLLDFVVPTRLVAVGAGWAPGIAAHFDGNDAERGGYLGLPVLAVVAWFAVKRWRSPRGRFLTLAFLAAAVASIGTSLRVDGRRVTPLPWGQLARLPVFNNVLPARLALFTSLAAAVIVALALRRAGGVVGVVAAAVIVLSLLPRLDIGVWSTTPSKPAFFAEGLYQRCLTPSDNVYYVPYGNRGNSMLWQAETHFGFRMAEGYLRPSPPASFVPYAAIWKVHFKDEVPTAKELRGFMRAKHVTRIVVEEPSLRDWAPVVAGFGPPTRLGGVAVYPSCTAA